VSAGGAAIVVDGLVKRYGDVVAVDGARFEVPRGRITGFLGRNGAGKSTTLKMLLGILAPTAGRARVLGRRSDDAREAVELRRRVAYVAEDKGLYAYMTVGELIRFTRSFYDDWHAPHEARLLEQYRLPLDRRVKALSKGMRTKLALLLALARRPELLILDEPTEGLDPAAIEELLAELTGRNAEGTTVFFSSHQLADVERIADDVVMLDRGKVVLDASMDDVRAHHRAVIIGFPAPPPGDLRMPGVDRVRVDGRQVVVTTSAGTDAVVARAHSLGASSVQVAPLSLRELFLDRVTP
jgi:ABC-2 type transport system ATP-binding protein